MTLRFAVITDIHLADNPPLGRQPGYQDQLLAKLAGVATYMRDTGPLDLLVCTGDIFHLKQPRLVSHSLVNRLIELFRYEFACPILICPGNHDLSEAGIDSLERQPLGSLFAADIATPLINDSWHIQRKGNVNAFFVGRHFDTNGDFDPNYYPIHEVERTTAAKAKTNVHIMVAHGSIVPNKKKKPIYDHIQADEIPWEDGKLVPDLLLCGHLHENYGIYKVPNGPIYVNLGSFGRPSRNQKDVDSRDFAVITISDDLKINIEPVPIPHMLPAAEVFLEKAEEHEDDALADFAQQLASDLILEDGSLDEALARLGEVPDAVKARARVYLEEAGL